MPQPNWVYLDYTCSLGDYTINMTIPTAKRLSHEGKKYNAIITKQILHHKYILVPSGTVAPHLGLSGHLGLLAHPGKHGHFGTLLACWHTGTVDRPMAQAGWWWHTQTPQSLAQTSMMCLVFHGFSVDSVDLVIWSRTGTMTSPSRSNPNPKNWKYVQNFEN